MKVTRVGIDLAKNHHQVVGLTEAGKVAFNRQLRSRRLLAELGQLEATTVAMETCAMAHYWGRHIEAMGHEVVLIPPQHSKPFVRGGKSDARDALGIAEAAGRPKLRPVPVKSHEQQDLQVLLRHRQRAIRHKTAVANQIRAVAREYGVCFNAGLKALRCQLPEALEEGHNELTPTARYILAELYNELMGAIETSERFTRMLIERAQLNPSYRRLQQIPGVRPIVAAAMLATVGDAKRFPNGRGLAAWLELVPKQHGTGGRLTLLGISKNGDRYLRSLVIHGARAALRWALSKRDHTPLARWARRSINAVAVPARPWPRRIRSNGCAG
jgi:transposase